MHQCSNHSAKLDIQDKEIQSNQVIHMVPLSCLWKNSPTQRHLLSVRVNIGTSSGSGSQPATTLVNRSFYHSFPKALFTDTLSHVQSTAIGQQRNSTKVQPIGKGTRCAGVSVNITYHSFPPLLRKPLSRPCWPSYPKIQGLTYFQTQSVILD